MALVLSHVAAASSCSRYSSPFLLFFVLLALVLLGPFLGVSSRSMAFKALSWAPILNSSSSTSVCASPVADQNGDLNLDGIRDSLIRLEDTIIFNIIERAQYKMNAPTYDASQFSIPGFEGSLVEYMLKETEQLHAKVRRYFSPDEHPFFPNDLPEPLLPPLQCPEVLHPYAKSININPLIWRRYFGDLLPKVATDGDDGSYGSTAVCDILTLQALSKRIHYGKFVAEAKFRESPELFEAAIQAQDKDALMQAITFESVEAMVLERVEKKARVYAQVIELNDTTTSPQYRIDPKEISRLYAEWVMPYTKKVQVQYLLHRLD